MIIARSSFSKKIVFCPHENERSEFSNFSGLKSVFEKFRFRDGLVCKIGLTVEIKLCFRDGLVWTVDLYRNKAVFS